ncbi:hypothetical protein ABNU44_08560 [Serratia marcescens]|uniref:hypothetical protein n=1 Tax=Serratia marcescens TaxID=615 RepID=UPI001A1C6805|nr:hypothetical protein [Serratia marcescens]HAU5729590.1 hypothetical protein [Serratia marcescens]HAU5748367.1 hypothetical protein [Serratia marcescens]
MDKFNYLKEQLAAALATWQQTNGGKTTVGWMHAANPEAIAALLAELEAVKAENALFRETGDYLIQAAYSAQERATAAEAKLATPVRLPDIRSDDYHETGWFQHMKYYRDVERSILAAGFAVGGE